MKRLLALVIAAMLASTALAACSSGSSGSASSSGTSSSSSTASSSTSSSSSTESNSAATTSSSSTSATTTAASVSAGSVPNTIAQDEEALVNTYAQKFQQVEYTDSSTGLSVTYNLFLPDGYDPSAKYPMVVFIGDSTCAGNDPTRSLTQGLGALVWASDEWQAANKCIVCVPTYPETILDDHNGYTTTEYVELTKRLIDSVAGQYAVDANRIYGTGQSMGCMTTLVLSSKYPDLYAACMYVDGQWDISTLSGLEGQKFVYFAAEDDKSAFSGMNEVMDMFKADNVAYTYKQWDGTWTPDELSAAASELFAAGTDANFISWKTGTIDASSAGGMGSGSAPSGKPSGSASGSAPSGSSSGGMGDRGSSSSSSGGGMGSVGYHMASFDYAYNCIAVMEWLFQQSK